MSEQDKIKRLAYKRNRKKWITFQSVIAIILALVIIGSVFAYFQLNKTYYLEYTEMGDVDYKVYIQDGEFKDKYYPEEYLKDKAYVASLISKIAADFSYKMNIQADSVDYTYKIDAILNIVHENSMKTVYEEIISLIPEKTVSNGSIFEIKESVDISFKEYNDKINKFFDDLKLNENDFESVLTVKLSVSAIATSEALVSTAANNYDVSLNIPLADLITIPEVTTSPIKENKLALKNAVDATIFKDTAVYGGICEAVVLLVLVLFSILSKNDDINYANKVQRLVNSYKSFIQKITNEFDNEGYQLLFVETFNEMLAIRDTIQSPILMSENKDQTKTQFLIPTNTKILYVYEIKVDNYDDIYGITKEEALPYEDLNEGIDESDDVVEEAEEIVSAPVIEEAAEPVIEEVAEPVIEEAAEPVIEEVAEPVIEEVAAPVIEEVAEPVIEEVAEPVIEEVAEPVTEEVAEPVTEEVIEPVEIAPIVTPTYVDGYGKELELSCSRSVTANIIQADEQTKGWYSEIKNYIMSFKGVKSKISWKFETFSRGRDHLVKLKLRGKTILVYLALTEEQVNKERYSYEYNGTKLFADVPIMVKIKSGLSLRRAKELVDLVMENFAIEVNPKAKEVDYVKEYPYEENEPLIERGLIKLLQKDTLNRVVAEPIKEDKTEEKPDDVSDFFEEEDVIIPPKRVIVVPSEAVIDDAPTSITETVEVISDTEVSDEEIAEAIVTPDIELEKIDFVDEAVESYEETEEKPGVEVIGVVWPERKDKNKIYKYDPNGEKINEGDIVLVPTRDVTKGRDVVRKAAVARGNYKVDPETIKHPLKRIIGVVKRTIEKALTPNV